MQTERRQRAHPEQTIEYHVNGTDRHKESHLVSESLHEDLSHRRYTMTVVPVEKLKVIPMLRARQYRKSRNLDGCAKVDQRRAKRCPRLLSLDRRRISFRRRLRETEQFLANLVRVFLEETVENDGICVIVGKASPLFRFLLTWQRVVLLENCNHIQR